jgi:hypothetical protein
MRFSRSTVLLLTSFVLGGCGGATSPGSVVNRRVYRLERVGGGELPVEVDSGAAGVTSLKSEFLTLESNDSALSEAHTVLSSPPGADVPAIINTLGTYRITGDSIEVGVFGSCPGSCPPNRVGVVADSSVTLISKTQGPTDRIYLFRLISDSSH